MKQIYSVSQVNQYIKNLFVRDNLLSRLYVKGEVSNCKYHSSGHIYFTLKDSLGQISCVMFAGNRKGLKFTLKEGQGVIVFGNVNVYERSGQYQIYATDIVLDGQGALYEEYEKLKIKLKEEGLFDEAYKKEIPKFAKKVGVVTAETGAVIQDIINVSSRRNPYVSLYLYPAIVQGESAGASIARGIKYLDKQNLDIVIVGRGGGSIEDLWAFNEETVARAIFECETPIISAVGHETDVTIADFVSDLRAPTPSAAAELAVYDYLEFTKELQLHHLNLTRLIKQKINLAKGKAREYTLKLEYGSPHYQIKQKRQRLVEIEDKLTNRMKQTLNNNKHKLEMHITKLEGLSPLRKLQQGYGYITDENQKSLKSVKEINTGDNIRVSLADGEIYSTVRQVTQINDESDQNGGYYGE